MLSAIFFDKEIIDTRFVTMNFIGRYYCVTGFCFIAPNKMDPII